MRFSFTLTALFFASSAADEPIYLVTGATGRTGSIIYKSLVAQGFQTRALVTNLTKAQLTLNCTKCDASEGIYVGDVTNISTLEAATAGVSFLANCVGLTSSASDEITADVEWHGVENQVASLADSALADNRAISSLQVAMISSMGTTNPDPATVMGGDVLFYKLQAETFLSTSGVPYTIVKPCGLTDGTAAEAELLVGHDDYLLSREGILENGYGAIPRADVSRVMVHSLTARKVGLRFDLCVKGARRNPTPTTDEELDTLLESAKWPWMA